MFYEICKTTLSQNLSFNSVSDRRWDSSPTEKWGSEGCGKRVGGSTVQHPARSPQTFRPPFFSRGRPESMIKTLIKDEGLRNSGFIDFVKHSSNLAVSGLDFEAPSACHFGAPKWPKHCNLQCFLTLSMHFLFKNLVFYSILWGSPSAALGAQKAAQIADTSAVLLAFGVNYVRPRKHRGNQIQSTPEASKTALVSGF